jgi:hypothetical protein
MEDFHMIEHEDDGLDERLNERERALFDALPKESPLTRDAEDRLIGALRAEGLLRPRRNASHWMLQLAAAAVLLAAGGFGGFVIGSREASRNSIDAMLARDDLVLTDRVLLLQRAGSAYVQAANRYADATTVIDSAAVDVARQVLLGAAQAVSSRSLDGGVTSLIAAALDTTHTTLPSAIWY